MSSKHAFEGQGRPIAIPPQVEYVGFEKFHGLIQHINLDPRAETAWHPLKIVVEQPDRETWRMHVAF